MQLKVSWCQKTFLTPKFTWFPPNHVWPHLSADQCSCHPSSSKHKHLWKVISVLDSLRSLWTAYLMFMTSWRNGKSSIHFSSLTLFSHFESNTGRDVEEEVKNKRNTGTIILATVWKLGKLTVSQVVRLPAKLSQQFYPRCTILSWRIDEKIISEKINF